MFTSLVFVVEDVENRLNGKKDGGRVQEGLMLCADTIHSFAQPVCPLLSLLFTDRQTPTLPNQSLTTCYLKNLTCLLSSPSLFTIL